MPKKLKTVGKVVKAVGLKGDVKIFPLDSYIDHIPNQKFLFIGDSPEKAKKHYASFVTKSGKFLRYRIHDNVDRKDAENLLKQGADLVGVGRVAIAYPNWGKNLNDINYNPKKPPFTKEHLKKSKLSKTFIDYMRHWDGFVID